MKKPKMSPTMAALLSEEHWVISEQMQDRMLQDIALRWKRCFQCRNVVLTDRREEDIGLHFSCKKNLPPTADCPEFIQNTEQIIIHCSRAIDPKEE